jgi:hypothetical protein
MIPAFLRAERRHRPRRDHAMTAPAMRVAAALALLLISGCAKTTVTSRQRYEGPQLARPGRVIVYDFASNASDLPAGYNLAVDAPNVQQASDDASLGRQLGAQVAKDLVGEIQAMGLPAVQAAGQPPPQLNDITIVGYFVSIDSGSVVKRFAIGFGSGAPELQTVVEVYVMSPQGLRRLGSAELNSAGSKAPGAALPLAVAVASGNPIGLIVSSAFKVEGQMSGRTTIEGSAKRTAKEIAEQLKVGAQRQGWIN